MERLTYEKSRSRWDEGRCPTKYTSRHTFQEVVARLAAYEDLGLGPEEITTEPYGCVFYCNRKCSLDGDWCAEGPGCPWEIDAEAAKHLLELAQAEKGGSLVVLQGGVTVHYLREEYRKAKCMADGRLPSPDYTTGRISGFGAGVIYILDKILAREEAEAALKKPEEAEQHGD